MTDSYTSLTKKRLARGVKILVVVQIFSLGIMALGVFLLKSDIVLDSSEGDIMRSLPGIVVIVGMVMLLVSTSWGGLKLIQVPFLPMWIQVYLWGLFAIILSLLFIAQTPSLSKGTPAFGIFACIVPLYCIIPQFFIARWLAKEAKDDTTAMG